MTFIDKDKQPKKQRHPLMVIIEGGAKGALDTHLSIVNDRFLRGHYLGGNKSIFSASKESKNTFLRLLHS